MEEEATQTNRTEQLKNWLKEPSNFIFVAILLLGIAIRLYYFSLTKSQPLWWDEADYLAYAKNLAGMGNVDWIISAKHNSLFPYLVAALFKIGFSEVSIKFLLELIPSILLIPLTYFTLSEMYKDQRIALISSFLMATLWPVLFNSMRFHLGIPSLVFGFLAIYTFWRGFENNKKIFGTIEANWAIPLSIVFVILCYSIRRGYFLFGVFFFIYLLSTRKLKDLLKNKSLWIGIAILVGLLLLTESFVFNSNASELSEGYYHGESPISFISLGVFSSYFSNISSDFPSVLLYLFWIGLAAILISTVFFFDKIRLKDPSSTKSDFFHIITIATTILFFMFILRVQDIFGEPRWYFPLILGSFVCVSKGFILISDYLKRFHKQLAILLLILLIGFGGYYELQHSDTIIKYKMDSYEGIKDAGLFLNANSNIEDLIIVAPQPQMAYYSERSVIHPKTFTEWNESKESVPFDLFLERLSQIERDTYLVVSFSEPGHPDWMAQTLHTNNGNQNILSAWQIPFTNTSVDFISQAQDIKQSVSYGEITFSLQGIYKEAFVYKVSKN